MNGTRPGTSQSLNGLTARLPRKISKARNSLTACERRPSRTPANGSRNPYCPGRVLTADNSRFMTTRAPALPSYKLEGKKLIRATRGQIVILERKGLEAMSNGFCGRPEAEYRRVTEMRELP